MTHTNPSRANAPATASGLSPLRRKLCLALLVLLAFSLGCTEFEPIGIETELARAFGADLAQIGQLISLFAITNAVATPILALTTGRFRRYTMLIAYSALCVAGNVIAAFAPSIEVLYVSRVVCGCIAGAFIAAGITFIPELVSPRHTSIAVAVVYAAYSIAMVIATSAGKALADTLDWRATMVSCLMLSVVTCVLLLAFLPHSGATDEPAPAREQVGLLLEPSIIACIAVFVFGAGSAYVLYGYVTPYLEEFLGLSASQTSLVLLTFGIMLFVSNLLSGVLDERYGLRSNIVLLAILTVVLLALWVVGERVAQSLFLIMILGLVMYAMSVPCISHFMGVASERHPKALTLASSLEPMTFNAGIALGTAVGGAIVTSSGLGMLGLFGAMMAAVALACAVAAVKLA